MASGTLYKADQDGSSIEMVAENLGTPLEIEIDHENEKVYWRDQVDDSIKRMNLDGTGEEVIAESDGFPPIAFTLDKKNDRLYWTRYNGVLVQSNLDGTGATDTTDIDERYNISYVENLSYNPTEDLFYWIYDGSAIERQALTDTTYSSAFTEIQPTSIGYDAGDKKVFWTDASRGALVMYDFNTQKDTVLTAIQNLNNLTPMDVDTSSNQVFVGSSGVITINYDGSIADTIDVDQAGSFSGIVADAENQTIYFTDNASTSFGNLKKVNYDGTGIETLIKQDLNYSRGIEFDLKNNTLYWASGFNEDSMRIKRMDLASELIEVVLNAQDHGLLSPLGIALDPKNEHLYWSDSQKKSIQRADYDGGNMLTILEGEFGVVRDIDAFVSGLNTSAEHSSDIASEVSLAQNYPNPFNPVTNISFTLNKAQSVSLTVYDMLGRKVQRILNNRTYTSGNHSIQFDASSLSSGVYIYQLEASGKMFTKKLTLIK